jgi:hypothetical protein
MSSWLTYLAVVLHFVENGPLIATSIPSVAARRQHHPSAISVMAKSIITVADALSDVQNELVIAVSHCVVSSPIEYTKSGNEASLDRGDGERVS